MKLQKRDNNPEKRQEKLAEKNTLKHRKEIRDRKYHLSDEDEDFEEAELIRKFVRGNGKHEE